MYLECIFEGCGCHNRHPLRKSSTGFWNLNLDMSVLGFFYEMVYT